MKRATAVLLICVLCLALAACGGSGNMNASKTPEQSEQTVQETPANQQTADQTPGAKPSASTTVSPEDNETDDTGVVAKSENTVSDKEKQQMLDEYTSEIDNLLNSIDNLDDVEDSDLDISRIQ